MHVPTEIKIRVDNEIMRCMNIAKRRFNREFQFPNVSYDKRGTTAGTATDGRYFINLNPILLMENVDHFIKQTVPHEFAHLVDGIVYPETRQSRGVVYTRRGVRRGKRSLHGRTWKSIMLLFGCQPDRCHSYDTKNAKTKNVATHVYVCRGCKKEMTLGPKRHGKMQIGIAQYWMHGCKRHGGYDYVGLEGQRKAPVPVAPPKPTLPTVTLPKPTFRPPTPMAKTTKLEDAVAVVRNYPELDRTSVIALIALTCGVSTGYAQTLYYQAKNG